MMLASSPTPVKGLKVVLAKGGAANVEWTPSAEKGITGYVIEYGLESNPAAVRMPVKEPKFLVPSVTLQERRKAVRRRSRP